MATLRVRKRARSEIDEAFEWYRERSPRTAGDFLAELDASLLERARRDRAVQDLTLDQYKT